MTTVALPAGRERWPAGMALGLFAIATLTFAWEFAAVLRLQVSSDLTQHIDYARRIQSLADLLSPHFLFQFLINAAYALGIGRESAAIWLLGGCYGGMAVLIGRELHRRSLVSNPFAAVGVVMAVLLASHLFWPWRNLYNGYFVPTAYHNPTQQLNKLFAVWIFFTYRKEFLGDRPASRRSVPGLAALCVLSAVAKPSFLIAFVPAAAIYAAHDLLRRRWRQAVMVLAGIGIPSALTALWQESLTQNAGQGVELAFRPFVVFDAVETMYKLPASLAFPLVVAAGAWWTHRSDASLRFIWVFTAIGMFVTLCVVESGARMMHGNLAWTGQTAVFLVYVESVLFLLAQRGGWTRAAWMVFAAHVACGLLWYHVFQRADWARWV